MKYLIQMMKELKVFTNTTSHKIVMAKSKSLNAILTGIFVVAGIGILVVRQDTVRAVVPPQDRRVTSTP